VGLFKKITSLFLIIACVHVFSEDTVHKEHILYLMQAQKFKQALTNYKEYCSQNKKPDFDLLQKLAYIVLEQGSQNSEEDIQMLTMFGAGQARSIKSISILSKGLENPNPKIQLVALHFLSNLQDDQIDSYLLKAMSSPILMTRLEALYMMSKRKHICALGQMEALMNHLPQEFKPLFPELLSILGTKEAKSYLKTFFHDNNINVRLASIIHASLTGQDDLLPLIQQRAKHPHVAEIEACIFSFSLFNDYSSIPFIQSMASHQSENVQLASHLALYNLGDKSHLSAIEKLALGGDVFATLCLGQMEGSENTLVKLLQSHEASLRANAALALLEKKDIRALPVIKEFLFSNQYDEGLKPVYSLGRTQMAFEVINSASSKKEDPMTPLALLQSVKEYVLTKCIELPEANFLSLAHELLVEEERDIFPLLISLLQNIKSPQTIAFLKKEALHGKTPIIRDWCNLALFKLKEKGPYERYVKNWVQYQSQNELIQLKEYIPWQMRLQKDSFNLTAQEKSSLMMEMILSLLSRKDIESVDTVLNVWMKGNEKNRYVLAGLLMKAIE